ncbi:MAG: FAD-binding protein, partial [Deltaproteobacteria bacterium]|nr:FAD-binding protein [Deltaproteobacteria bacterium]
IFATGGAGRIYSNTTNALVSTGLGFAIPYWAGVPLKDMEFIQFHPTTLYGTNILMTEGCRGEGGFLLNNRGERFLANYPDSAKAMEVAPRDIVARNITREILAGRGFENAYVHLDMRHLGEGKIVDRLPGIRDLSINFAGVDPVKEPVPVQPGQHYTMGGIDTNDKCETIYKGLYAAGECACVSVHGANRLGGNSLLDTIVFGKIAGEAAADYVQGLTAGKGADSLLKEALKEEESKIAELKSRSGNENPSVIKNELASVMAEKVGIFREEKQLAEALVRVRALKSRFPGVSLKYKGGNCNFDLLWTLELKGNLDVAEVITLGALLRKESRGSQFRLDYDKRDDQNFLRHTLARWDGKEPRIEYSPVALGL